MRQIQLFFYYPFCGLHSVSVKCEGLQFADEIDCKDLFPGENQQGNNRNNSNWEKSRVEILKVKEREGGEHYGRS